MTSIAESLPDHELGRILLVMRGAQWIMSAGDDPYALLLRAGSDDPHALGERVRERGPLYRSISGPWVTADHGLCEALLADPRLSPRPPAPAAPPEDEEPAAAPSPWDLPALYELLPLDGAFVNLDRPDHERLRVLAGTLALDRYRPDPAAVLRRRPGRLGPEFDLMTDVIRPSVADGIAGLLGVTGEERERFAGLCAGTATMVDATLCPPPLKTARELLVSVAGTRELVAAAIEAGRKASPSAEGERPIGALLRAAEDTGDVLAICVLLAVVGVELTADLIGDAMAALLGDQEQWDALRADPDRAADVVEETLRHAPPVRLQRFFVREDVELAGRPVAAGEQVVAAIAAANRDPAVFPDPGRFDPGREGRAAHLSLRPGTDAGLLAPVIRSRAVAVLRAIATEFAGIRVAGPVLRRLRSPVTGAVLRFPVATE